MSTEKAKANEVQHNDETVIYAGSPNVYITEYSLSVWF
jgi:hypothetical protein